MQKQSFFVSNSKRSLIFLCRQKLSLYLIQYLVNISTGELVCYGGVFMIKRLKEWTIPYLVNKKCTWEFALVYSTENVQKMIKNTFTETYVFFIVHVSKLCTFSYKSFTSFLRIRSHLICWFLLSLSQDVDKLFAAFIMKGEQFNSIRINRIPNIFV